MKTVVPGPQGFQGVPGGTGGAGGIGPAGPPGLNWRGTWSFTASYAANDAVTLGGVDWICLYPNTNIIPAAGSVYWSLLVQAPTGASGASAVEGIEAGYGNGTYEATTSWALIGLSTPPTVAITPGTYLIYARVAASSNELTGYVTHWQFRVYDVTAAAAVANTTREWIVAENASDPSVISSEIVIPVVQYIVSVNTTLELQAIIDYPLGSATVYQADIVAVKINL